jgi:E3 Ubiquitin ligase
MPLIGVGAGLYLFFRGFLLLQRKRLIQNTPISKVRSASLGLVEVSGLAAGPYTMAAPITSAPCFCYRTVAWQEKGSDKDHSWEIVAEEKLHVPFFLDDNTGKLLVDPTGAELDLHRDFQQEFSDSIFSTDSAAPQNVRDFLLRHGVDGGRKTRIDEFCIKPKNFLFILGTLAENPGLAVAPRAAPLVESRLITSTVGLGSFAAELTLPSLAKTISTVPWKDAALPHDVVDLTAALPAPADSGQMTQQAKIAAALQRAGIKMPDVRALTPADRSNRTERTASSAPLASKNNTPSGSNGEQATDGSSQAPEFDLKPPVVLMKGKNNTDYLISWRDQRKVVSSMGWKSALMIWGGPILMLVCLYVLAAQFGWL